MAKNQEHTSSEKFSDRYPRTNAFIGLVMIVLMGYGIIAVIRNAVEVIGKSLLWLVETVSSLDVVIIVALISGMVSIVGIVVSSIVAKTLEYKRARREYLTQKREVAYAEFIDMIYKLQQSSKPGKAYPQNEMVEDILRFSKQITLWGSSRVVNNWVKFKEIAAGGNEGIENLLITEQLMNDMRKDLGLSRVKKGNLLAFFINDIKEVMRKRK